MVRSAEHITKFQRNDIFQLVKICKFDPTEFDPWKHDGTRSTLTHRATGYYFTVEVDLDDKRQFHVSCSPFKDVEADDIDRAGDWEDVERSLIR